MKGGTKVWQAPTPPGLLCTLPKSPPLLGAPQLWWVEPTGGLACDHHRHKKKHSSSGRRFTGSGLIWFDSKSVSKEKS